MKPSIRQAGSAINSNSFQTKVLPSDKNRSFFGPPVIARRVIQESNPLRQPRVLKVLNSHRDSKKGSSAPATGNLIPTSKVQRLKETRDYSFLFDDDEDPFKKPSPQCVSVQNSESDPPKEKRRQPLKTVSLSGLMHCKAGFQKATSVSKRNGIRASQPGGGEGPKDLHSNSKAPVSAPEKAASTPAVKNPPTGTVQRVPSQHMEQRKGKEISKVAEANSKAEKNKPLKRSSSRAGLQDHRPRKRPGRWYSDDDDDDVDVDNHQNDYVKALTMIQRMFKRDEQPLLLLTEAENWERKRR